jgi:hypothetical protein
MHAWIELQSLKTEVSAYREALQAIKRHQTIAGGSLTAMSTTWAIANAALKKFCTERLQDRNQFPNNPGANPMGQPITMYQADDGSIHPTPEAMQIRDTEVAENQEITHFIESTDDWSRGEATRARRLITSFLAHRRLRDQSAAAEASTPADDDA